MESAWRRGGVPVFNRPKRNPNPFNSSENWFVAGSPNRPPLCFCCPKYINPLRKVPVVKTTALAKTENSASLNRQSVCLSIASLVTKPESFIHRACFYSCESKSNLAGGLCGRGCHRTIEEARITNPRPYCPNDSSEHTGTAQETQLSLHHWIGHR